MEKWTKSTFWATFVLEIIIYFCDLVHFSFVPFNYYPTHNYCTHQVKTSKLRVINTRRNRNNCNNYEIIVACTSKYCS